MMTKVSRQRRSGRPLIEQGSWPGIGEVHATGGKEAEEFSVGITQVHTMVVVVEVD